MRLFLPPIALAAAVVFPPSIWAAEINVETATIGDLQAAFQKGTLASEKLQLYLGRIAAYDKYGPAINAIITLNPNALAEARALDAERKAGKVRGPLHGIPIVLKDNFNTFDMPTTAGSQLLEGSIPPADGFLTKKLRDAGAIGFGTDTGGSVRGPSSANGIVGLRPTYGLLSRTGIVPNALSLDTAGPVARSDYDIAVVLGVGAGIDLADAATMKSAGRVETDTQSS
jgi:amidase